MIIVTSHFILLPHPHLYTGFPLSAPSTPTLAPPITPIDPSSTPPTFNTPNAGHHRVPEPSLQRFLFSSPDHLPTRIHRPARKTLLQTKPRQRKASRVALFHQDTLPMKLHLGNDMLWINSRFSQPSRNRNTNTPRFNTSPV